MTESELLHNLRTAKLIKEQNRGIWVEYQDVPGKPWVTVDWATVQHAIAELDRQIADLQTIVALAIAWQKSFVHGRDTTDEGFSVADEAAENALYDAAEAAGKDVTP